MSTVTVYPKLMDLLVNAGLDWDADTIRAVLLKDTYTFDAAHDFYNDISAFEAVGTGYTAGGQTLTSKTSTYTAPWRVLDAADPAWASSTIDAQYCALVRWTGTPSTSALLGLIDAEIVVSSSSSTFTIPFDPDGVIRIGQAA